MNWTEDWTTFITEVARLAREGATTDFLSKTFGHKTVRWHGVVDEKDLDEMAPGVSVDMPEMQVDLGEGHVAKVADLHLPVCRDAINDWDRVQSGDEVSFEATLGSGDAPFPPVEVITLRSGRMLLMLRVYNARIVHQSNS